MATNKHATIRYHALDRCFSNFGRKFFMEDLVIACNEALYEYAGIEDGVKRRQIYDDITFMESEQGWSIPLERKKDGKKVYYRYSDRSFSIKNQGINQSEAEQLRETLSILSRFKGLPQFEWLEEIQVRLEDTFKLKGSLQTAVSFEQNPYLKGLNYFTEIFNAIQNETVLNVSYKGYKQENVDDILIHPWFLKQYNNRWFLFGYNEIYDAVSNLAIDRILSLDILKAKYIRNDKIDFEEYFDDVVGVTVKNDVKTEKVQLKISKDLWPYIESKPIHGSQKIKEKSNDDILIELKVQINYELLSVLFSYMDNIEIIAPEGLRGKFKNISEVLYKKYF